MNSFSGFYSEQDGHAQKSLVGKLNPLGESLANINPYAQTQDPESLVEAIKKCDVSLDDLSLSAFEAGNGFRSLLLMSRPGIEVKAFAWHGRCGIHDHPREGHGRTFGLLYVAAGAGIIEERFEPVGGLERHVVRTGMQLLRPGEASVLDGSGIHRVGAADPWIGCLTLHVYIGGMDRERMRDDFIALM